MKQARDLSNSKKLVDGSRVAVIGGGPAGSFFSYFLLGLAEQVGLQLEVDIFEPRDFSLPAPRGCNMCAGVISETLVQNMAFEGIHLPGSVVQKAIDSYVLHTDLGSQKIEAASQEKRIGVVFRSSGPNGIQGRQLQGLDEYLLSLAEGRGANIIRSRVTGVERSGEMALVKSREGVKDGYDLLAVATGVNTPALKLFRDIEPQYRQPVTTKTAIREYRLDQESVEKSFGDSLHVFLLNIPRLDFAMLIPKGEYVSVCMLGDHIDDELLQAFLTAPEVSRLFPAGWRWDQPVCQCGARINVRAADHPYADGLVFIGDSGVTRLYKDGIGSAYRAAKAAAACAVLQGIAASDFERHYAPFCRGIEADNFLGRLVFSSAHLVQHVRFIRQAVLAMTAFEQRSPRRTPYMSSVLWDMFTGSAPYREVLQRTIHPAFCGRLASSMVNSFAGSLQMLF